MKVLTFVNHYLPGYRAGGPIRSLVGLVEQLHGNVEFSIVTCDRDFGATTPYPGIKTGRWTAVDNARVCYVPGINWTILRALLSCERWNILYLQSFFDPYYTLRPLLWHRLGRLTADHVLIAPRGEFSPGAMNLKKWKKQAFLQLCKFDPLYRRVYWHAATHDERANILRAIPRVAAADRIFTAPNLYAQHSPENGTPEHFVRRDNLLRVLFLSRITEMKNLKFAIQILKGVKCSVEFNIYGTLEPNLQYWKECEQELSELPQHIHAKYHGEVPHDQVHELYSAHDVLLLPSKGESFGHVILESLRAGCPVLISDRTPWKGLEEDGVGWTFSLDSVVPYQKVLEYLADTPLQERRDRREACIQCASAYISNDDNAVQSRRMFETIAGQHVGSTIKTGIN